MYMKKSQTRTTRSDNFFKGRGEKSPVAIWDSQSIRDIQRQKGALKAVTSLCSEEFSWYVNQLKESKYPELLNCIEF